MSVLVMLSAPLVATQPEQIFGFQNSWDSGGSDLSQGPVNRPTPKICKTRGKNTNGGTSPQLGPVFPPSPTYVLLR